MRPLLLIGMTALLLCTAGCSNPISKLIDDFSGSDTTTAQQSTTTEQSSAQQSSVLSQTQQQQQQQQPQQQQPQQATASAPAQNAAVDTQLQQMTPEPPNTHGQIRGTEVRMRGGPSTDDEILGYFENREYVSILGSANGWYHVRRADGTECWVSGDFCKKI